MKETKTIRAEEGKKDGGQATRYGQQEDRTTFLKECRDGIITRNQLRQFFVRLTKAIGYEGEWKGGARDRDT